MVLERGWLSSNNIVFSMGRQSPVSVVDTGYASHDAQTLQLLREVAGQAGVGRILNTHLHSDHCGGNAAVQAEWGCHTSVPEVSLDAVRRWDEDRLTYRATGQTCHRFRADAGLAVGEVVQLGRRPWRVLAAPGHDPESVMLFQEDSRVLISADALWESRLAIVFPELAGDGGFEEVEAVLDTIDTLAPRVVIPGHGAPFDQVGEALNVSRRRVRQFKADPEKHAKAAARSLAMFRMLELRQSDRDQFETWLNGASVFRQVVGRGFESAQAIIDSLLNDGLLVQRGAVIGLSS